MLTSNDINLPDSTVHYSILKAFSVKTYYSIKIYYLLCHLRFTSLLGIKKAPSYWCLEIYIYLF